MPIQKVARFGGTAYKVQIRRRGFPSAFRTFSRYGDARAFEERILREQAVRAAYGCNVNLLLDFDPRHPPPAYPPPAITASIASGDLPSRSHRRRRRSRQPW